MWQGWQLQNGTDEEKLKTLAFQQQAGRIKRREIKDRNAVLLLLISKNHYVTVVESWTKSEGGEKSEDSLRGE